jgi:predicted PurR-regulated permease PerM
MYFSIGLFTNRVAIAVNCFSSLLLAPYIAVYFLAVKAQLRELSQKLLSD